MKALWVHAALCAVLLATAGCGRQTDEQRAIALLQQAGGKLSYDKEGKVVSVDLSGTQATDDELAAIGAIPSVRTINCTNARQIKGSGLAFLGNLKDLETLYLVGTELDDAGLSSVRNLTALKTLNLDSTRITDAGMSAIDHLTNLQTLVLGNTSITDDGLVQLRDLRKLSTLVLRDTKTSPQGIQELRRMLPAEVRIVR